MNKSCFAIQLGGLGLLVAALVQGCGGSATTSPPTGGVSDPGGADDNGPVAMADFPAQYGSTFCDSLAGCCRAAGVAYDSATCKANAARSLRTKIGSLDPTRISYDGTAVRDCLDLYGAFLSSCSTEQTEPANVAAACNRALAGTVPTGGACTQTQECALVPGSGVSCDIDSQGGNSCSAEPVVDVHGKLGEACLGSCANSDCPITSSGLTGTTALCYTADGLFCDKQQTCQPLLDDGAACTPNACKLGSYCPDGVCVPRKPDGADCYGAEECAANHCQFPADPNAPPGGKCGGTPFTDVGSCSGNL